MSYHFNAGADRRTTTPVYQALAVRPVSTAKNVRFDKTLLYGKWYIDNGQDGKQHVFEVRSLNGAIRIAGLPFPTDNLILSSRFIGKWVRTTDG
ncbi:hypothetical protein NXW64_04865 [Bacteroides ovatus]|nr:hypothetical protein NXW64_04865 [Bacteroides ovatus]